LGRKIGSDNYRYSEALRNKEGVWTKEKLSEFLSNPSSFASGTSMPQPPLTQEEIHDVVETLEHAPANQHENHAGNARQPE
jgi:cytochrome c2